MVSENECDVNNKICFIEHSLLLSKLTHISLASYVNSADEDQMPQNVVSDQGLHCLLT